MFYLPIVSIEKGTADFNLFSQITFSYWQHVNTVVQSTTEKNGAGKKCSCNGGKLHFSTVNLAYVSYLQSIMLRAGLVSHHFSHLDSWLSRLTHLSSWDGGFSLWKASPHSCKHNRDIQRLDRLNALFDLPRQTQLYSYLLQVLACVRNHLWANYHTYRTRDTIIPVS